MNAFDTTTTNSPLVIGVSGHRNLHPDSIARVKQQVCELLEQLKRRMPDTELRILVGMAQGADLLVAQLALDAGLHVDAVLPMPLEQYAHDFDSKSAELLKSLLGHAKVRCTVLAPTANSLDRVGAPTGDERDALYVNITDVLIDKSNVLLALWNGQASPLPGGTADTVLRFLSARTYENTDQRQITLVKADANPAWGAHFVYWIPAPRSNADSTLTEQPSYLSEIGENLLAVHNNMPQELELQLTELNTYNREFERLRTKGAFPALDSLMSALPHPAQAPERQSLQRIDAEYGKADALAVYYQRYSDRLFRCFSYLGYSMALLFLVYAKLVASNVLLSLYLGILSISLVLFYWVRSRQWFFKHLVYRVLAETMRTKFFLHMAAADGLVNAAELINLTGINQFAGFSWIGNVLKNVEPLSPRQQGTASADQAQLQAIHQHWIRGQQSYFKTRVRKLERSHHRLERMKSSLLYVIALLTIILVAFTHTLYAKLIGTVSFKDACVFLMGLLPVWLGIWELYQNKMATRELLWQYRNQLGHFSRAELQLSRSSTANRHRAILAEVGKESLMESYLWTIHRFHREHEPPAAA